MTARASVVVVSRGRPLDLVRCLLGLSQQDHPAFEIVVVACPDGMRAVGALPFAGHLKCTGFDEPNIAKARNLGIAQAAGETVAFIDDDAVPEPLWLRRLCDALHATGAAAVGGRVLGRNGISAQWPPASVDATGRAHPVHVPSDRPCIPLLPDTHAFKTEGTNMAFRRDVLAMLGGFDPAFAFFHDDTDLNRRVAEAGLATAFAPHAVVHHGSAASSRRAPDRTPRDLFEIAASHAVFLRKHCPQPARARAWAVFRDGQRERLLRAMQRGPLGADDFLRLLRGCDRGQAEGLGRNHGERAAFNLGENDFRAFPGRPNAARRVFAAWPWAQARALRKAGDWVAEGGIASVFVLSPTALYHRVGFVSPGIWVQTGGVFGRSERSAPLVRLRSFQGRVAAEVARVVPARGT